MILWVRAVFLFVVRMPISRRATFSLWISTVCRTEKWRRTWVVGFNRRYGFTLDDSNALIFILDRSWSQTYIRFILSPVLEREERLNHISWKGLPVLVALIFFECKANTSSIWFTLKASQELGGHNHLTSLLRLYCQFIYFRSILKWLQKEEHGHVWNKNTWQESHSTFYLNIFIITIFHFYWSTFVIKICTVLRPSQYFDMRICRIHCCYLLPWVTVVSYLHWVHHGGTSVLNREKLNKHACG